MGLGGIGIGELLLILIIVLVLFGTKRLGSIGADLGNAIKGFKNSMREGEAQEQSRIEKREGEVIEGEVRKERDKV
jgi:sec-independent protein translocase protein TatA